MNVKNNETKIKIAHKNLGRDTERYSEDIERIKKWGG